MTPLEFYYLRYLAIHDMPKLANLLNRWSTMTGTHLNVTHSRIYYSSHLSDPFNNVDYFIEHVLNDWCDDWIELVRKEFR
jgi:hypothetical protein